MPRRNTSIVPKCLVSTSVHSQHASLFAGNHAAMAQFRAYRDRMIAKHREIDYRMYWKVYEVEKDDTDTVWLIVQLVGIPYISAN